MEFTTPSPVKITAVLAARTGRSEELKTLLLRWDIWQDQTRSDRYVLDELYVDDAAVAAHRETAHYKDYLLRIGDLAERTALVLSPVAVESGRSQVRQHVSP
jgi:quinol monooxygenase YgiN